MLESINNQSPELIQLAMSRLAADEAAADIVRSDPSLLDVVKLAEEFLAAKNSFVPGRQGYELLWQKLDQPELVTETDIGRYTSRESISGQSLRSSYFVSFTQVMKRTTWGVAMMAVVVFVFVGARSRTVTEVGPGVFEQELMTMSDDFQADNQISGADIPVASKSSVNNTDSLDTLLNDLELSLINDDSLEIANEEADLVLESFSDLDSFSKEYEQEF